MTDPFEGDEPPPEELEMAVEEMTGKPFPGKPEERVEALKRRIDYLSCRILSLDPADQDLLKRYSQELAEAKKQLTEWQAQHKGRN